MLKALTTLHFDSFFRYGDVPIYTTMKADSAKAMLSRTMFEAADEETKLRLVREESMAIAMERCVVPSLIRGTAGQYSSWTGETNYASCTEKAYAVGLRMTLTTLSKGWFRDFGLEHYPQLKDCDKDLVNLVLKDGRLAVDEAGDWVARSPTRTSTDKYRLAGPKLTVLKAALRSQQDQMQKLSFNVGDHIIHTEQSRLIRLVEVHTKDKDPVYLSVPLYTDQACGSAEPCYSVDVTVCVADDASKKFANVVDSPAGTQQTHLRLTLERDEDTGAAFAVKKVAVLGKRWYGEPKKKLKPKKYKEQAALSKHHLEGLAIIGVYCTGGADADGASDSDAAWVPACTETPESFIAAVQRLGAGTTLLQCARVNVVSDVSFRGGFANPTPTPTPTPSFHMKYPSSHAQRYISSYREGFTKDQLAHAPPGVLDTGITAPMREAASVHAETLTMAYDALAGVTSAVALVAGTTGPTPMRVAQDRAEAEAKQQSEQDGKIVVLKDGKFTIEPVVLAGADKSTGVNDTGRAGSPTLKDAPRVDWKELLQGCVVIDPAKQTAPRVHRWSLPNGALLTTTETHDQRYTSFDDDGRQRSSAWFRRKQYEASNTVTKTNYNLKIELSDTEGRLPPLTLLGAVAGEERSSWDTDDQYCAITTCSFAEIGYCQNWETPDDCECDICECDRSPRAWSSPLLKYAAMMGVATSATPYWIDLLFQIAGTRQSPQYCDLGLGRDGWGEMLTEEVRADLRLQFPATKALGFHEWATLLWIKKLPAKQAKAFLALSLAPVIATRIMAVERVMAIACTRQGRFRDEITTLADSGPWVPPTPLPSQHADGTAVASMVGDTGGDVQTASSALDGTVDTHDSPHNGSTQGSQPCAKDGVSPSPETPRESANEREGEGEGEGKTLDSLPAHATYITAHIHRPIHKQHALMRLALKGSVDSDADADVESSHGSNDQAPDLADDLDLNGERNPTVDKYVFDDRDVLALIAAAGFDLVTKGDSEVYEHLNTMVRQAVESIVPGILAVHQSNNLTDADAPITLQTVLSALAHCACDEPGAWRPETELLMWCDRLMAKEAPVPAHLTPYVDRIRSRIPAVALGALLRSQRPIASGRAFDTERVVAKARGVLHTPRPSERHMLDAGIATWQLRSGEMGPESSFVLAALFRDEFMSDLVLPYLRGIDVEQCAIALSDGFMHVRPSHSNHDVTASTMPSTQCDRPVDPNSASRWAWQSPEMEYAWAHAWMGLEGANTFADNWPEHMHGKDVYKILKLVHPHTEITEHALAIVRDMGLRFVQRVTQTLVRLLQESEPDPAATTTAAAASEDNEGMHTVCIKIVRKPGLISRQHLVFDTASVDAGDACDPGDAGISKGMMPCGQCKQLNPKASFSGDQWALAVDTTDGRGISRCMKSTGMTCQTCSRSVAWCKACCVANTTVDKAEHARLNAAMEAAIRFALPGELFTHGCSESRKAATKLIVAWGQREETNRPAEAFGLVEGSSLTSSEWMHPLLSNDVERFKVTSAIGPGNDHVNAHPHTVLEELNVRKAKKEKEKEKESGQDCGWKPALRAAAGLLSNPLEYHRIMESIVHCSPVPVSEGVKALALGALSSTMIAAVCEYIFAEILELSGNAARDTCQGYITPRHLKLAVTNDEELDIMFSGCCFGNAGNLPHMLRPITTRPRGVPLAIDEGKYEGRHDGPDADPVSDDDNEVTLPACASHVLLVLETAHSGNPRQCMHTAARGLHRGSPAEGTGATGHTKSRTHTDVDAESGINVLNAEDVRSASPMDVVSAAIQSTGSPHGDNRSLGDGTSASFLHEGSGNCSLGTGAGASFLHEGSNATDIGVTARVPLLGRGPHSSDGGTRDTLHAAVLAASIESSHVAFALGEHETLINDLHEEFENEDDIPSHLFRQEIQPSIPPTPTTTITATMPQSTTGGIRVETSSDWAWIDMLDKIISPCDHPALSGQDGLPQLEKKTALVRSARVQMTHRLGCVRLLPAALTPDQLLFTPPPPARLTHTEPQDGSAIATKTELDEALLDGETQPVTERLAPPTAGTAKRGGREAARDMDASFTAYLEGATEEGLLEDGRSESLIFVKPGHRGAIRPMNEIAPTFHVETQIPADRAVHQYLAKQAFAARVGPCLGAQTLWVLARKAGVLALDEGAVLRELEATVQAWLDVTLARVLDRTASAGVTGLDLPAEVVLRGLGTDVLGLRQQNQPAGKPGHAAFPTTEEQHPCGPPSGMYFDAVGLDAPMTPEQDAVASMHGQDDTTTWRKFTDVARLREMDDGDGNVYNELRAAYAPVIGGLPCQAGGYSPPTASHARAVAEIHLAQQFSVGLVIPKRAFQQRAVLTARRLAGADVWIPRLAMAGVQMCLEKYLQGVLEAALRLACHHHRTLLLAPDIACIRSLRSSAPDVRAARVPPLHEFAQAHGFVAAAGDYGNESTPLVCLVVPDDAKDEMVVFPTEDCTVYVSVPHTFLAMDATRSAFTDNLEEFQSAVGGRMVQEADPITANLCITYMSNLLSMGHCPHFCIRPSRFATQLLKEVDKADKNNKFRQAPPIMTVIRKTVTPQRDDVRKIAMTGEAASLVQLVLEAKVLAVLQTAAQLARNPGAVVLKRPRITASDLKAAGIDLAGSKGTNPTIEDGLLALARAVEQHALSEHALTRHRLPVLDTRVLTLAKSIIETTGGCTHLGGTHGRFFGGW